MWDERGKGVDAARTIIGNDMNIRRRVYMKFRVSRSSKHVRYDASRGKETHPSFTKQTRRTSLPSLWQTCSLGGTSCCYISMKTSASARLPDTEVLSPTWYTKTDVKSGSTRRSHSSVAPGMSCASVKLQ
jgi:hypothetical protein